MHCPKCRARMVSYQRDGMLIEQCSDCRAVFLGEDELVRLVESGGGSVPRLTVNGHTRPPYEGRHRRN